jgi:hypothetical protein
MRVKRLALLAALGCASLLLGCCAGNRRTASVPDHPIEDHPVSLQGDTLEAQEKAMAKLIAQSRAELPEIRRRFAAGLAEGNTLYFTVRLFKADRAFEQAFVRVEHWGTEGVTGVIAPDLVAFTEPKRGDTLKFPESMVVDWTILGPGGTEEGNRVGHYLESGTDRP